MAENVKASRIGTASTIRTPSDSITDAGWKIAKRSPRRQIRRPGVGRPNMLLDEEAAGVLDERTGGAVGYSMSPRLPRRNAIRSGGPGNDQPTVKPLKLMQYLLTLLSTPTGGWVLDPFAGSGSTLLAAKTLGRPASASSRKSGTAKLPPPVWLQCQQRF